MEGRSACGQGRNKTPPPAQASPPFPPSHLPLSQVRVWLANDHYYILSRYLVARQLTAATAPPKAARRAAAALKKSLVDGGRLDITAAEMEAALFDVLGPAGVPASVRDTYATVARFAGARRGLLVAVAGAPWSGAPRVAARLAAALNLAAPAHTDLLSVALRGSGGALPAVPPWARECDLEAALDREARVMRAALQGELDKVRVKRVGGVGETGRVASTNDLKKNSSPPSFLSVRPRRPVHRAGRRPARSLPLRRRL